LRHGNLDKKGKVYRAVDKTVKKIDWASANATDYLDIRWPYGIEDESRFGFDGRVIIPNGSVAVLAGFSNAGKSCFSLNFIYENMDIHDCVLMVNEYSPSQFRRRVDRMKWKSPFLDDGTPKFEMIERHENWQDVIKPDAVTVIDWVAMPTNFYEIRTIVENIQGKLGKGMALVILQKSSQKEYGEGGEFGSHKATLYMTMDKNILRVIKNKEGDSNFDGKIYGFEVVDYGSHFHRIRELKVCPKCHGWSVKRKTKCETCLSTGYVEKEDI
jgi:hypothetical protein